MLFIISILIQTSENCLTSWTSNGHEICKHVRGSDIFKSGPLKPPYHRELLIVGIAEDRIVIGLHNPHSTLRAGLKYLQAILY